MFFCFLFFCFSLFLLVLLAIVAQMEKFIHVGFKKTFYQKNFNDSIPIYCVLCEIGLAKRVSDVPNARTFEKVPRSLEGKGGGAVRPV